jgi:hypothetical protein
MVAAMGLILGSEAGANAGLRTIIRNVVRLTAHGTAGRWKEGGCDGRVC